MTMDSQTCRSTAGSWKREWCTDPATAVRKLMACRARLSYREMGGRGGTRLSRGAGKGKMLAWASQLLLAELNYSSVVKGRQAHVHARTAG